MAQARLRAAILLAFDGDEANSDPSGEEILERAITIDQQYWSELLPVEHPLFAETSMSERLGDLEHRWTELFDIDTTSLERHMVIETARRALEIACDWEKRPSASLRSLIINMLNLFDHKDERYLCDWDAERRTSTFTRYVKNLAFRRNALQKELRQMGIVCSATFTRHAMFL